MGTKLYVGNLNYNTSEAALREAFGANGREVISVSIIMDRETGRPRGFAFVEMATQEAAQQALAELDGQDLEGRMLRINEAREREPRGAGAPSTGGYRGSRPSGGFGGPPSGGGYAGGGGGYSSGGGAPGPAPGPGSDATPLGGPAPRPAGRPGGFRNAPAPPAGQRRGRGGGDKDRDRGGGGGEDRGKKKKRNSGDDGW